jgi:DNA-binding transcriptional MerR regulator
MEESHTEYVRYEGLQDSLTIKQAATLLGVHPNTVRKRVKDGLYKAEKVSTEHGFTWMIHRNTLLNTPHTTDLQAGPTNFVVSPDTTPETLVQGLLRPFVEDLGRVSEELGAERMRREQAEEKVARLEAELEALREAQEASLTPSQEEVGTEEGGSAPQEPTQRRSWLYRFFFGS